MSLTYPYKPFGILRFALALAVMIQHFCADIAPVAIKQTVYPWAPGNIAVLGFFILSGFIVCEAYHNNYRDRPFAYLQNRCLRIVPGYWAALLVSILVHYALFRHYGDLTSLDRHTIGIQYFGIGNLTRNFFAIVPPIQVNMTQDQYPFIPYVWALQTEMIFYLTIFFAGVAYPFLSRISNFPQNWWLALAGYIGIVCGVGANMHWLPRQLAYGSYFAFGGALFFLLIGHRRAVLVLLPALAQMLWHFRTYAAEDFTVIPANRAGQFGLFILVLIAITMLALSHVRRARIDRKFGELSYPLYLNHYVIGVVALNTGAVTAGDLVGSAGASFALAAVMFWLVDRPLIEIRNAVRQV